MVGTILVTCSVACLEPNLLIKFKSPVGELAKKCQNALSPPRKMVAVGLTAAMRGSPGLLLLQLFLLAVASAEEVHRCEYPTNVGTATTTY